MTKFILVTLCAAGSIMSFFLFSKPARAGAGQKEGTPSDFVRLKDKNPLNRIEAVLDINRDNLAGPKTVQALINCILSDDNTYVREIASDVLSSMGPYAKDSAPRMVKILEDRTAGTEHRARAAQVLGAIGGQAPKSVGPLLDTLDEPRQPTRLRESVMLALLSFGRLPADSVSRIERIAFDPGENIQIRKLAMLSLAKTGRDARSAIPGLSTLLLKAPVLELREQAAYAIGEISSESQVAFEVKTLTQILASNGETTALRVSVARALRAMGERGGDALPELRDIAVKPSTSHPAELRLACLDAMQQIGQGARLYSTDLAKLATTAGDNLEVRTKAAQVLSSVRPGPAELIEMANLAKDLREPLELRRAAMGAMHPDDSTVRDVSDTLTNILANTAQDSDVRRQAAQTLAQLRPVPPAVISAFVKIIKDPTAEMDLRRGITAAAGTAGPDAASTVPILARLLSDSPDLLLRRQACSALMAIGRNGEGVVPALETILGRDDLDPELRSSAVLALGAVAVGDKATDAQVVPVLLDILKNAKDVQMRRNVPPYLGQMDVGDTDAVKILGQIVEAPREDLELRTRAVSALGGIAGAHDISQVVPGMVKVLQSDQEQIGLRQTIAHTLARIRPRTRSVVTALVTVMRESGDRQLRASTASALGTAGEGSEVAAAALAAILNARNADDNLRYTAMTALGTTGLVAKPYLHPLLDSLVHERTAYPALQGIVNYAVKADTAGDVGSLPILKQAEAIASSRPALADIEGRGGFKLVAELQRSIASLEAQKYAQGKHLVSHILDAIDQHPIISALVIVCVLWMLVCQVLFVWYPIWLLKISDFAVLLEREKIRGIARGLSVPLGWLILLPCMRFHPRSLDAWVREKVPMARMKFLAQPTVREREVYVDLPVQINAEITQRFTPESLQEAFNEPRTLILVAGEGGAGKTSIACQIGKWAAASSGSSGLCDHLLLPLLIEGDIILRTDRANEQFQQTVRGVLRDLLNDNEPPSNEMLMSLLKHKRILVIVDGFSEMSDAGQSTIQPVDPTFPANALLITSRSLEHFSETGRTTINPQRLEKSSLVTFMERYLEKRGKLELLSNQEFQDQAASLQRLVGGRKITPLFARLYIDLSVAAKEGADESSLPKTVPDLVLEYLNLLNRKIVSARKEDYEVHRLARIVAGKCVMPNLRPTPARISDVLSALGDGLDAGNDLTYLEKRLGLLQTSRFGEEVHFTLDPLAEYLAAIGLVEEYKDNKDMWREFLDLVDNTPGAPSVVSGFLEAVSDCYLREYPTGPEDFIVREIHVRRDSSL